MPRRRMTMAKAQEVEEMFEYVEDMPIKNNFGSMHIKFQTNENALYILLPKNNTYIKDIVINVWENKYAFMTCNKEATGGAWVERNYTLSDGMVDFTVKIGENKAETVDFEVYKRSL